MLNIEDKGIVIAAMPAYNEELFIAKTILGCKPFVDKILVVNDGSTDFTSTIANALDAIVIDHETNKGYGAAIRTCFDTAKNMNVKAMIIIDSDGQHDCAEIEHVLLPVLKGEADVSIGSRFLENKSEIPLYRKFGMKILDTLTNAGSNVKFSDTQSGFRAYSKKAIDTIRISNDGMSAGSEILLQIKKNNLKTKEVPITCRYDIEDTSTHNPICHGIKVFTDVVTEIEYGHPLIFIGLPGIFLLLLGLIDTWHVLYIYNSRGYVPYGPAILMVLLILAGMLSIFMALTLHSMSRFLKRNIE